MYTVPGLRASPSNPTQSNETIPVAWSHASHVSKRRLMVARTARS